MGAGDVFTAALILAATGWLLYRSLFRKGGGCHGCSGEGCGKRPPAEGTLVRLGGAPGHRAGDRGSSR